jgi:hypothetical protein
VHSGSCPKGLLKRLSFAVESLQKAVFDEKEYSNS